MFIGLVIREKCIIFVWIVNVWIVHKMKCRRKSFEHLLICLLCYSVSYYFFNCSSQFSKALSLLLYWNIFTSCKRVSFYFLSLLVIVYMYLILKLDHFTFNYNDIWLITHRVLFVTTCDRFQLPFWSHQPKEWWDQVTNAEANIWTGNCKHIKRESIW